MYFKSILSKVKVKKIAPVSDIRVLMLIHSCMYFHLLVVGLSKKKNVSAHTF